MADDTACNAEGCERAAKWRGLCQRHYIEDQYRDVPEPTDEELARRIFPKIIENPETGCWEWQGAGHARYGHGMFGYNALGRNITKYVHIWMWEYLVCPVPDSLVLDHLCRVTNCCNPAHLEPVTDRVNNLRGESRSAKNMRKTHCKRGHLLDGDNLKIYQGKYGPQRSCVACQKLYSQRRRVKSLKL